MCSLAPYRVSWVRFDPVWYDIIDCGKNGVRFLITQGIVKLLLSVHGRFGASSHFARSLTQEEHSTARLAGAWTTQRGSTENTGQVHLLCGMKEVRANNCHYQEFSTRKGNHKSHYQFKSAKLLRKPLIQSQRTNRTAERKIPPRESPTLQVVRLTRYRTNFSSSIRSPTVPLSAKTRRQPPLQTPDTSLSQHSYLI